ncbi:rhomboid family intramembrane serine protease [Halobacteriovorax sp. GB3]|uniref:rhomboid family intramembrane serine protease n=1 Tax=Halobacteriovorax sp. GB3 TaxID=2719615 RepID=UPI00235EFCEA|nr:rhomboid family intramembrane serine protease [Halobacteriovorax sp. GB3]MDD0852278.1 rhomboid family intramembrane serine protease [Halobacteriovorax sp. GB3]
MDVKIAELKDGELARKIVEELRNQSVSASCQREIIPDHGEIFGLYIANESDRERAIEVFCLMTGLGSPRPKEMPKEWLAMRSLSMGPVTLVVLVLCAVVFFSWKVMGSENVYRLFLITNLQNAGLLEITNGEFWRLVTPSFLHFGWMHVIFNLLWWKDLGKVVESTKGPLYLVLFVILISLGSNLGQYYISGPLFGGLSGVVYALLGRLWVQRLIDDKFEFGLPKQDAILMIAWFFLGLLNIMDMRMANMAHAMGLTLGMLSYLLVPECFKLLKSYAKLKLYGALLSFALLIPVITYFVELFHGRN